MVFVIFVYMGHKNEYLVRLSETWYEDGKINIESGKYEGSGLYITIHGDSWEEVIEKWNDKYCPEELKRDWGDCGEHESLVMVINHKGHVKFYM